MLKHFVKTATIRGGTIADYLEWVVDQWHTIAAALWLRVLLKYNNTIWTSRVGQSPTLDMPEKAPPK